MSHATTLIARRTGAALLALLLTAGLFAGSANAVTAPAPSAAALAASPAAKVSGTWVLAQIGSARQLSHQRPFIAAALSTPGIRGLSMRVPWTAIDSDLTLLDQGHAIARAQGKQFTVRFIAGQWTPPRVFAEGSPYYVERGDKIPLPFMRDGSPNRAFERAYAQLVGRLAGWSRSRGVRLLHLSWYGERFAELNLREQVQQAPGYTYDRWLQAQGRLSDIGYAASGADLTVEYPTSGGGIAGMYGDIADMFVQRYGAYNPRYLLQGNFWQEGHDGGPMYSRPVFRGSQAGHGGDNNWPVMYGYLRNNGSLYGEVYISSFSAPRTKDALRSEIRRFSDYWAAKLRTQ